MLKIIRRSPPTKNFIELQPALVLLGANCDDLIHKDTKMLFNKYPWNKYSLVRRHICSYTHNHCINKMAVDVSSRTIFMTTLASNSVILRPKKLALTPQKRHFSFQNSMQSLAATQSGIFKTLSESTPVEYCQKFLLYVHDFTGLPWWASIIISTILIRSAITFPLAIYQQSIVARLENLKLELPEIANELKKETSMAVRLYNWDEKTAKAAFNRSMKKQWNNLIVRDNCHPLKTTVLLWVQIPLWISMSVSLRNLVYMLPLQDINSHLTFTELMVGGFAFIPNLTIPDSSWIFPVTLGILNLAIIEIQVLSRQPSTQSSKIQTFLTNTFRVISVIMVPIAASVPSCLVLYWTTSSAYGLAQNLFLMSPRVKRLFKIPETIVEVKEPYKMVVANFKSKFKLT